MCRSRRELSNEYLLAKFGFNTAENEPCKVCPLSAYRSLRFQATRRENRRGLRASRGNLRVLTGLRPQRRRFQPCVRLLLFVDRNKAVDTLLDVELDQGTQRIIIDLFRRSGTPRRSSKQFVRGCCLGIVRYLETGSSWIKSPSAPFGKSSERCVGVIIAFIELHTENVSSLDVRRRKR